MMMEGAWKDGMSVIGEYEGKTYVLHTAGLRASPS